jgi:TolA-binding protein
MNNRLGSAIAWIACWFRSRAQIAGALKQAISNNGELRRSLQEVETLSESVAREVGRHEQTLREKDDRIHELEGENEILRAQIQQFVIWQGREQARLEAETAMQASLKVRALESPAYRDEMQ